MVEFPIVQCAWPTAGEYCSSRIPTLRQWAIEDLVVGVALEEPEPTMRPLEFVRGRLC
jgi:hypothetical protein